MLLLPHFFYTRHGVRHGGEHGGRQGGAQDDERGDQERRGGELRVRADCAGVVAKRVCFGDGWL